MPWKIKDRINDATFKKACLEANSMSEAAAKLGLHFNSFKKRALELGCYKPNQAGIGIRKNMPSIPIEDIIKHGKHPNYQSFKLKKRLIKEGLKENVCENCGVSDWQNQKLEMELHHIDGNRFNHLLSNIQLLCPNCHSQTDTFRAKNKKH